MIVFKKLFMLFAASLSLLFCLTAEADPLFPDKQAKPQRSDFSRALGETAANMRQDYDETDLQQAQKSLTELKLQQSIDRETQQFYKNSQPSTGQNPLTPFNSAGLFQNGQGLGGWGLGSWGTNNSAKTQQTGAEKQNFEFGFKSMPEKADSIEKPETQSKLPELK
ncbi:MAG: hypothetical protein K2X27_16555 [Candidatus Obscuribacterales bacterium]|nr:hypothetical protein [Candidatus Obscuribacterales bacterium]